MNWVWGLSIPYGPKIVLLAIADYANDDGYAWPGYKTLAKKTGMANSTLSKQLKILVASGLMEKSYHSEVGVGRKLNTYTLNMGVGLSEGSRVGLKANIKELGKELSRPLNPTLGTRQLQPSKSVAPTLIHEPLFKPPLKQPSIEKYPEELNVSSWNKYKKYRREKKLKTLSRMSEEEKIKELISYGDYGVQEGCINKTISEGWKSIYPPVNNNNVGGSNGKSQQSNNSVFAQGTAGAFKKAPPTY